MPIARPSRMIAASGVLGLLVILFGLGACSGSSAGAGNEQTRYIALSHSVLTTYPAGHRKLAPAISGTDLDGKPLDLAQLAGKVVVLNFWASWCPPCRSEAPALEQVYTDTKASGVQFVGVDIREAGKSDGVQFARAHNIDYPSFADQSARIALAFRDTGIVPETPPSTMVLDRHGRIAARCLGELTYSELSSIVQAVAKESL